MVLAYWKNISSRAVAETAKSLGIDTMGAFLIKGLAVTTAVAALLFWGSADASRDELIARVGIIAFLLLAFPFVFVWKVIRLPARLAMEDKAHIAILRNAVAERKASIENIRALTVLWERGLDYGTEETSEEKWPELLERIGKWEILTTAFLGQYFSHQDAVAFKVVHYKPENYVRKVNDQHGSKVIEMMARCVVLKAIIERDNRGWATISKEQRAKVVSDLDQFQTQVSAANR